MRDPAALVPLTTSGQQQAESDDLKILEIVAEIERRSVLCFQTENVRYNFNNEHAFFQLLDMLNQRTLRNFFDQHVRWEWNITERRLTLLPRVDPLPKSFSSGLSYKIHSGLENLARQQPFLQDICKRIIPVSEPVMWHWDSSAPKQKLIWQHRPGGLFAFEVPTPDSVDPASC